MFKYTVPDIKISGYFTTDGILKFDPPVYEQRYNMVCRILDDPQWQLPFKKIAEFGCAEMKLLKFLKSLKNVEHILQIDVDEATLTNYEERANPILSDYLTKREKPLRIEVLRGCVTIPDQHLIDVDAVLAIELIEHLNANILSRVPENIFGFIQPKLVIITTPNRDVNILLNGLNAKGFRHYDHKFEWTREEFETWAIDICIKYPNYIFSISGIGKLPIEHKNLGCISQIAIFIRKDIINDFIGEVSTTPSSIPTNINLEDIYKEICVVDFPFKPDNRTTEQKILEEAEHQILHYSREEKYLDDEQQFYLFPVDRIKNYADSLNVTETDFNTIIQKCYYKIKNAHFVIPVDEELDHSLEEDEFENCITDDDYEEEKDLKEKEDLGNGMCNF